MWFPGDEDNGSQTGSDEFSADESIHSSNDEESDGFNDSDSDISNDLGESQLQHEPYKTLFQLCRQGRAQPLSDWIETYPDLDLNFVPHPDEGHPLLAYGIDFPRSSDNYSQEVLLFLINHPKVDISNHKEYFLWIWTEIFDNTYNHNNFAKLIIALLEQERFPINEPLIMTSRFFGFLKNSSINYISDYKTHLISFLHLCLYAFSIVMESCSPEDPADIITAKRIKKNVLQMIQAIVNNPSFTTTELWVDGEGYSPLELALTVNLLEALGPLYQQFPVCSVEHLEKLKEKNVFYNLIINSPQDILQAFKLNGVNCPEEYLKEFLEQLTHFQRAQQKNVPQVNISAFYDALINCFKNSSLYKNACADQVFQLSTLYKDGAIKCKTGTSVINPIRRYFEICTRLGERNDEMRLRLADIAQGSKRAVVKVQDTMAREKTEKMLKRF